MYCLLFFTLSKVYLELFAYLFFKPVKCSWLARFQELAESRLPCALWAGSASSRRPYKDICDGLMSAWHKRAEEMLETELDWSLTHRVTFTHLTWLFDTFDMNIRHFNSSLITGNRNKE